MYVGDVARANVLVMEDARADFRAFNVAGQRATSVLEYAQIAARACGKQIEPVVNGEYRFGDTRHTVSTWQALGELGWRPQVPLEQVVAEYAEWVRAQPDLEDFYSRSAARMRQADILRRAGA